MLFISFQAFAQFPSSPGPGAGGQNPAQYNIGRFYGKVVDEASGKGIAYASIQLWGMRFDTVSHTMKDKLLGGQLSEENGDFSLENLPIFGEFTLKISYMGYGSTEQKVTFGLKGGRPGGGPGGPPASGGQPGGGRPAGGQPGGGRPSGGLPGGLSASSFDKDLGNIKLAPSAQLLKEVTIEGSSGQVTLALDRKIYHVDKDASAAGGTAEDALKNIPSLNVDIDGNLTMRNAAPQLFVDGRPTNLTLDQIPSSVIESVEVITNPSAKYDASGGSAGIVNIVLKKEKRVGYNGNVRAGIDRRAKVNLGGDINAREGKINVFLSGNFNQRKSLNTGTTDRENLFGSPLYNIHQTNQGENNGYFGMGRAGLDWFINNRNTITAAGSINRGNFNSSDNQQIRADTIHGSDVVPGYSTRTSANTRNYTNYGSQLLYKHLFPKEGKELTADLNLNGAKSDNNGHYLSTYQSKFADSRQIQVGSGANQFFTAQSDYVNPLTNGMKMELGARAAIRDFRSDNNNSQSKDNGYVNVPGFADHYKFNDQVYAAYATFSKSYPKWGFQAGLRAESSTYTGVLLDNDSTFKTKFPVSLFPSAFLTYKLNDEDNIQLSYSRRINRPNFFQLIPFTDYSDSTNLSRGNPNLKPEFTNSLELSYQNIISKEHNVLVSVYYKHSSDLITRYSSIVAGHTNQILSTFFNANSSYAYGTELTVKNTLLKIFELTSNINLYHSTVDATNVQANLTSNQFTWFIKEYLNVKLPAAFTLQLSGSYQSRTAFAIDNGGGNNRGGPGGGGWMGGPTNTAQGYSIPVWFADFSIRKDLWKKTATITLSFQDVFATRRSGSHTASEFFIQDSTRQRDPQMVRLNFSYRFGKFDVSLFKRKNTRMETEGGDF
jgi:outer membrane receptor protein involved in Fe transport